MNTVFLNFKNSKTSDPYRLLLNLIDKINLKRSSKYVALLLALLLYCWYILYIEEYKKVI